MPIHIITRAEHAESIQVTRADRSPMIDVRSNADGMIQPASATDAGACEVCRIPLAFDPSRFPCYRMLASVHGFSLRWLSR